MINLDQYVFDLVDKYTHNTYLISLIIFIFFLSLSKVMAILIGKIFMKFAKHTETELDDVILERTQSPLTYLIFFLGLKLALFPLNLTGVIGKVISNLVLSAIVITITLIVIRIADAFIEVWGKQWVQKTKSTLDDTLLPLIHKFIMIVIIIVGFLVVLGQWGISVGPFLASLGIAGIAIGFALQNSLGNVFGGIALILDKNFAVDDVIKLSNGLEGKVVDIGVRSTKIQTWDNEIMIIPNGELANMIFTNFAKPELLERVQIDFGVEYGSDVNQVKKVVLDAVNKIDKVLAQPETSVRFKKMNDFSMDFTAYVWTSSYMDRLEVRDKANQAIYEALRKANIGIPFPTRTIYMKKE